MSSGCFDDERLTTSMCKRDNVWILVLVCGVVWCYLEGGRKPRIAMIIGISGKDELRHFHRDTKNLLNQCIISGTNRIGDDEICW